MGVGVWGTAAIGATVSTGAYVIQASVTGEPITPGGLLGAAVGGALAGLTAGSIGVSSWLRLLGGGAAAGAAAGATQSLVQQVVDKGTVSTTEVLKSAGWGGVGGLRGAG